MNNTKFEFGITKTPLPTKQSNLYINASRFNLNNHLLARQANIIGNDCYRNYHRIGHGYGSARLKKYDMEQGLGPLVGEFRGHRVVIRHSNW
jgi:hypothetical protein